MKKNKRIPTLDTLPPAPTGKTGWPWTRVPAPIIIPDGLELPSISIVTPSYQQGIFIEETIRSILLQGYPNLQYIIIDGGSTDETVAIIKKYEQWIDFWVSEPDKGQTDAINKGLAKCTGEVFNWLNSDDYYEPNALLEIGVLFAQNPNSKLVCGKERVFDDATGQTKFINQGTKLTPNLEQTAALSHLDQPSSFFKQQTISDLGGLNADLHFVMDAELFLRFLLKFGQNNILKSDTIWVNFRHHDQSKTVSLTTRFESEKNSVFLDLFSNIAIPEPLKAVFQERVKIKLHYTHSQWPAFQKDLVYKIAADFCVYYMHDFYQNKDYKKAKSLLTFYIKYGHIEWNKPFFSLFVRLYIFRFFS